MSNKQPSEAATALALEIIIGISGKWILDISVTTLNDLALRLDEFAALAVEAERARVLAALNREKQKTAWEGSHEIADPYSQHPDYWEGANRAFDEAIVIVKGEP